MTCLIRTRRKRLSRRCRSSARGHTRQGSSPPLGWGWRITSSGKTSFAAGGSPGGRVAAATRGVAGRRGGAGRRAAGGRGGVSLEGAAAGALQARCGCPTGFLAGRHVAPGPHNRFLLPAAFPSAPLAWLLLGPPTRSPPAGFHLYLHPLSPAHLIPALPSPPSPCPSDCFRIAALRAPPSLAPGPRHLLCPPTPTAGSPLPPHPRPGAPRPGTNPHGRASVAGWLGGGGRAHPWPLECPEPAPRSAPAPPPSARPPRAGHFHFHAGGGRGDRPGAGQRTFRTPAQPPAHLGGPALPWAPGRAARGDRGRSTRVREGRCHLAPTLLGAPREAWLS